MVDNKGNAYRTRELVIVFCVLIGLALALVAWGTGFVSAVPAVGIFLIVTGLAITAVGLTFSGTPDKFGPSEQLYRVAMGPLIAVIGAVLLLTNYSLEWYIYAAILIVGIAVIGLTVGLISSRKINNE